MTSRDGHGDNGMSDSIEGLVSLESKFGKRHYLYHTSSGWIVESFDLTGDEDPIDEDGDTEVGDSEVLVSLGEISLGGKKSQESNIGGTKDEDKAVGEKTSVAKRRCSGTEDIDGQKKKSIIVKVLTLFSIKMGLIPICNTAILKNIAAEANLG
nr:hypothetical protein [Tanacetum cinerariifolium]